MGARIDKVKGKVKERVGDATNNRNLEAEGKADQAVAGVKNAAGKVQEKVEKAVDTIADKADDVRR